MKRQKSAIRTLRLSAPKSGRARLKTPNKRDRRANGLALLPLALRPLFLGERNVKNGYTHSQVIPTEILSKLSKHNAATKPIKIVVMSTIFCIPSLFSLISPASASAASITLSVPTKPLSLSVQPNDTFAKSSPSSVSVKTDSEAGYELSVKAKNGNELVNDGKKIPSITNNLTEEQYKGAGHTNTWGYQPSKLNGEENALFLPGPTSEASLIEKTSVKNDTANNYNITLGAKVDSSTPTGAYSNTFIFTATANEELKLHNYNITYELNGGSWTGKSPQVGSTTDNFVKLDSATPTIVGYSYEFGGWCTVRIGTREACSYGNTYQPGEDFPLNNDDNTITLWAIWECSIEVCEPVISDSQPVVQEAIDKTNEETVDVEISEFSPSEAGETPAEAAKWALDSALQEGWIPFINEQFAVEIFNIDMADGTQPDGIISVTIVRENNISEPVAIAYYDEANGKWDFAEFTIKADGSLTIDFEHFCTVVIITRRK